MDSIELRARKLKSFNVHCVTHQLPQTLGREFKPVGPAKCAAINKGAGEKASVTQWVEQRAFVAVQIGPPIKKPVRVVTEFQLQFPGCRLLNFENHLIKVGSLGLRHRDLQN